MKRASYLYLCEWVRVWLYITCYFLSCTGFLLRYGCSFHGDRPSNKAERKCTVSALYSHTSQDWTAYCIWCNNPLFLPKVCQSSGPKCYAIKLFCIHECLCWNLHAFERNFFCKVGFLLDTVPAYYYQGDTYLSLILWEMKNVWKKNYGKMGLIMSETLNSK